MRTLKTIILAATLAFAPAMTLAQTVAAQTAAPVVEAVPAPAAPAPVAAVEGAKPETPAATSETYESLKPVQGIGMPISGAIHLEEQVTENGRAGLWMHNILLLPIITVISLFVLGLLLYVVARYRRAANPVPSKTSHNTLIEIIWTLAPVLILVVVAVPSIKLIAAQFEQKQADVTIKVIGNQWYWTYEYPDHGGIEIVSNMLKEKSEVKAGERSRTDADGPRLLAVDERIVVPAGKVIKLIVTSNDVIHSFAVPAFWTKMDAVPGRLNETWFQVDADKEGVYFGQCSELCGARHGFMPIAVEVVSPEKFAQWVRVKGGKMPGADAVAKAPAADVAAADVANAAPAVAAN